MRRSNCSGGSLRINQPGLSLPRGTQGNRKKDLHNEHGLACVVLLRGCSCGERRSSLRLRNDGAFFSEPFRQTVWRRAVFGNRQRRLGLLQRNSGVPADRARRQLRFSRGQPHACTRSGGAGDQHLFSASLRPISWRQFASMTSELSTHPRAWNARMSGRTWSLMHVRRYFVASLFLRAAANSSPAIHSTRVGWFITSQPSSKPNLAMRALPVKSMLSL